MFEWHGWATVVASPGTEDDQAADEAQRAAESHVAALIKQAAGVHNEVVDVRAANGRPHVWLAGSHNHRDDRVVDLFETIAKSAPGSYGVLYVLDDDLSSSWERWVMRRGQITRETDASLSPTWASSKISNRSAKRGPHRGGDPISGYDRANGMPPSRSAADADAKNS